MLGKNSALLIIIQGLAGGVIKKNKKILRWNLDKGTMNNNKLRKIISFHFFLHLRWIKYSYLRNKFPADQSTKGNSSEWRKKKFFGIVFKIWRIDTWTYIYCSFYLIIKDIQFHSYKISIRCYLETKMRKTDFN